MISTLVSIYDSKDLFVKELQILLAERLLSISDGNYEREIRNIEILKLRFGETALHVCEVMLKDMTDSKRVDQRVHQDHQVCSLNICPTNSLLTSTLVSSTCFNRLQTFLAAPQCFQCQNAQDHEQVSTVLVIHVPTTNVYHSVLAAYEQQYIKQKADKRLLWIPQIGKVSLHIELADRSLDVEVGVVEAAIIELFGEKGENSFEKHCLFLLTSPITDVWTLNELAEALGTDVNVARKAAAQWIELRVVNEDTPHTYRLLEKQEAETTSVANRDDEADAPSAAPARQQQAEQVRVFWRVSQLAGSTSANVKY